MEHFAVYMFFVRHSGIARLNAKTVVTRKMLYLRFQLKNIRPNRVFSLLKMCQEMQMSWFILCNDKFVNL